MTDDARRADQRVHAARARARRAWVGTDGAEPDGRRRRRCRTTTSSAKDFTRGSATRTPRSIALARGRRSRARRDAVRDARAVRASRQDAAVRRTRSSPRASRASSSRCAIRVATRAAASSKLRAAGIRVDVGVERDAALELNAPFFNAHGERASVGDAQARALGRRRVADPSGEHRWITGAELAREVHRTARQRRRDRRRHRHRARRRSRAHRARRAGAARRAAPRRVRLAGCECRSTSTLVRTARETPTVVIAATGRGPIRASPRCRTRASRS